MPRKANHQFNDTPSAVKVRCSHDLLVKFAMNEPRPPLQVPAALQSELEALILSGDTIAAVKHLRAELGIGLGDAKHWVDAWLAENYERFNRARRDRNKAATSTPRTDDASAP